MTTNTISAPVCAIHDTADTPTVYAQPAPRYPGHPLWDEPGVWTRFIQTRQGTQTVSLVGCNPGKITRTKNDGSRTSLEVPRSNRDVLAECQRWMREVAYYRNGRLMFVGPITKRRRSTTQGSVGFDAGWVGSYLNKRVRVAEEAVDNNFFQNPAFVDGLANWAGRTPPGMPVISGATLDPTGNESGGQCAVLSGSSNFQSLAQTLLFTSFHFDFTLEISARVKIDPGVEPGRLIAIEVHGVSATPGYTSANIYSTTPRNVWTTIKCQVAVDGTTQPQIVINPSFHGGSGGLIKVDHCFATIVGLRELLKDQYGNDDSLPEALPPVDDAGRIAAKIVQAAGNDLNIGVDSPFTNFTAGDGPGPPRLCWDQLATMVAGDNFDVGEHITQYTRTIKTFHPTGGRDVDPEVFTLTPIRVDGRPPTCTSIDEEEDDTDLVNDLFATGPDGTFGRATDTEPMDGFALQGVRPAESGLVEQAQLNGWAYTNLVRDPGEAASVKAEGIDCKWLDVIDVMDRVWVYDPDGWPAPLDGYWEIVQIEIDANDTMSWTLNKPATV